ncbi:transposase [Frankia sp. CNm7]|uniref:Transposase n=1 Tax=Frankia nepalensis TaxID=1836974 RepID=A0A937UTC5_9ACTN|nr:transposase [Frankia nepalensis]MBL7510614.1 transposase [Frankia nepalensis]MBL7517354.1 transposase [Frankia nepalensis]MBL7633437.1 transposase [Frankia nepalensis]
MDGPLAPRLVLDELWELVKPLLLELTSRRQRRSRAAVPDRAVFTAAAFVLTTGCASRHLPQGFLVSPATAFSMTFRHRQATDDNRYV